MCFRDKSSNGTWVNGNKVTVTDRCDRCLYSSCSLSLQVSPCLASVQIRIDNVQVGKDKMWPLEHNSDEKEVTLKEGDAEKKEDEEKEICRQNNGKDKTTILIIYIECA